MSWFTRKKAENQDLLEVYEERILKLERVVFLLKTKVQQLDKLVQASLRKTSIGD